MTSSQAMDGCERGGWTFFPFCGWHGIQGWGMGVIREVLLFPSSITITTTEPAEVCFNRLFSRHVLFVVESMGLLMLDCLKNHTTNPVVS
jgi:hypothetical protein